MKNYTVTIAYHDSGIIETAEFKIDCVELDDLKTAFLKRLGNIHEAPNKTMKEKPLVKEITYSARSIAEWVQRVNVLTRWGLSITER